jgi:hypothetical protein
MSVPRFIRRGLLAFAAAVALCERAPSAQALTVQAPTFTHLVAAAEQIARVEITGLSARWDTGPAGRMIHTYVQCRVMRMLKGPAAETLSLRFMGGQVGDYRLVIPDMPAFQTGATYVLFIAGNGRAFCPLVAVGYGSYPVRRDAAGIERITRASGSSLRTLDEIATPDQRPDRPDPHAPARTDAMTCTAFEHSILHVLHPESAD